MHRNIRVHSTVAPVAVVGTNQVFSIAQVKAGDRLKAGAIRRMIPADAASLSTWQLALHTANTVLGSTVDTEGAVGSLADCGTVATLVSADDVVELRYTASGTPGATAPKVRVTIDVDKNQESI